MNETNCTDLAVLYPDIVDITWVRGLFGTLYAVVLCCGLFGNCLTLYCLLALKVNVGVHTSFILSLTLSNLLIATTCLPVSAVQIFARVWLLGKHLCAAVPLFQAAGIFVCSFTLAVIAIDRYIQVSSMLPTPRFHPWWQYSLAVLLLWILAIAAAVPYAYFMTLRPNQYVCGLYCDEDWPLTARRVYGSATMAIQFVLPLTVLAYCYGQLAKKVGSNVRRRLAYNMTEESKGRLLRRQKKSSTLMLLLVVAFIVPWLPYNAMTLLRDFDFIHPDYVMVTHALIFLVAMTSTMWNPIIYCGLNADFKTAVKALFCPSKHGFRPSTSKEGYSLTSQKLSPDENHVGAAITAGSLHRKTQSVTV